MSTFNLPPPWDPKYAIPQNVEDEGLERHGYVTQWAQRGSFDNPRVGTAGYAVPQYIQEETYGRGAMVTKWAPRGSYAGPKVKHWLDYPSGKVIAKTRLPNGATKVEFKTVDGFDLGSPKGLAIGAGIALAAYLLLRKKR